jgi:hypothetical protein
MGHAKGGAISFYWHLTYIILQQLDQPKDIRFKPIAVPDPNLEIYAYEYEAMTQGGWAYNVVNSADGFLKCLFHSNFERFQ